MRMQALAIAIASTGCAPSPPRVAIPPSPDIAVGEDACGARALASLIGQPVSKAPRPSGERAVRVVAEGDAVTMDYNPQRLNIYYDRSSGRIIGIKCG